MSISDNKIINGTLIDDYVGQITAKNVIICTIFLGIVCWRLNTLWKLRIVTKSVEGIAGAKPWPLLGNAHFLIRNGFDHVSSQMLKYCEMYPDLSKMWVGDKIMIFVTKPEYIEIVMNSQEALSKTDWYMYSHFYMGNGLGTGRVEDWRQNRKIIQPTFHKKILDGYLDEINRHSAIFVKILREKCRNGNEIELEKYATNFAVDSYIATTLGISETSVQYNDKGIDFLDIFEKVSQIPFARISRAWLQFEPFYRCTNLYQEQKETQRKLKLVRDELLGRIKKKIHSESIANDHYKPFPDEILRNNAKCPMSEQQFLDEFNAFFVAGVDTNAKTLSFVCLMLALNPQVQEQLYEEVMQVLGNRSICLRDLNELKYTECVIKETLRLIPIIPILGRKTTSPINLGDSLVIPQDCQVIFLLQYVHTRADYWEEPMEFRPERFQRENIANHHPYAWIPFSGGPRNCIGTKVAMMQLKIAVANVIREFKIHSRDYSRFEQVEFVANVAMHTKKTLRLHFEPRFLTK